MECDFGSLSLGNGCIDFEDTSFLFFYARLRRVFCYIKLPYLGIVYRISLTKWQMLKHMFWYVQLSQQLHTNAIILQHLQTLSLHVLFHRTPARLAIVSTSLYVNYSLRHREGL